MGLLGGMTRISTSELDAAVDRIANYYRHSRLYLDVSNAIDAYDYYVKEYTKDIETMINTQHCYKYKGNYLIATDMLEFKEAYPEVFTHFYGIIPNLLTYMSREKNPVMFINSFGPSKDTMTTDSYKLVNMFVAKYSKDYVILSDCITGIDLETDHFEKATRCRQIILNSNPFYRWN